MQCPCGSSQHYAQCCEPIHNTLNAPTPLALMRSRFSAYALNKPSYILATQLPLLSPLDNKAKEELESIAYFCKHEQFKSLEIIEANKAFVEFKAHLGSGVMHERSAFVLIENRWYYNPKNSQMMSC